MEYEDAIEHNRTKMEDLQQRAEQFQQEREASLVRLDQQKKFYEEEREHRRQRELELLQQRKVLQDANGAVRQKEQLIAQQKKLHEDELSRWKHKEQVLTRRVEQLQRDWRSATSKLEQTQREQTQQRNLYQADQNRAYRSRQDVARRTTISENNAETRALLDGQEVEPLEVDPERVESTDTTLRDIEDQAARELQAWRERRAAARDGGEDDKNEPEGSSDERSGRGRSMFRPRPWMLK